MQATIDFFEDKGLKQIKRDWQSPVPDARRFDQIWVEQVHALKGAHRMRD